MNQTTLVKIVRPRFFQTLYRANFALLMVFISSLFLFTLSIFLREDFYIKEFIAYSRFLFLEFVIFVLLPILGFRFFLSVLKRYEQQMFKDVSTYGKIIGIIGIAPVVVCIEDYGFWSFFEAQDLIPYYGGVYIINSIIFFLIIFVIFGIKEEIVSVIKSGSLITRGLGLVLSVWFAYSVISWVFWVVQVIFN